VLIFNAREHIGHKDASITLSTPPSAGRVPGSYDNPLSRVKLPKMSQGGPHYATAWRRRDPAGVSGLPTIDRALRHRRQIIQMVRRDHGGLSP